MENKNWLVDVEYYGECEAGMPVIVDGNVQIALGKSIQLSTEAPDHMTAIYNIEERLANSVSWHITYVREIDNGNIQSNDGGNS